MKQVILIALLLITTVTMMSLAVKNDQLERSYPQPGPVPACHCSK